MYSPGPITMLLMFMISLLIYVLIGSLLLRLATRWVIREWRPWGQMFRVVLINLGIVIVINVLLGVTLAVTGVSGSGMSTMEENPLLHLLTFIVSMLASAYVYGHWITRGEYDEPIGFGRGLLIYWAQILFTIALGLILGIIALAIPGLMKVN